MIVCSGVLCPIVYTERVEEWDMPDPAKMPLEEARKIRALDLIERIKSEKV